jgi:transcriptional regulator with GAF, ATPase, and Fis domain
VEAADGGSIFLDEIRELDPVLQAKLLNLLDSQEFRRVGAVRSKKVDTRFIAATNRILWGEVRAGTFRDDLYYRLQVVAINVPPLRERGEDVHGTRGARHVSSL